MKHTVNGREKLVAAIACHRAAFIALLNQLLIHSNKASRYLWCLPLSRRFCGNTKAEKGERRKPEMKSRPLVKVTRSCRGFSLIFLFIWNYYIENEYGEMRYNFCSSFPMLLNNERKNIGYLSSSFLYFHFFCLNYHTQKHTSTLCLLFDLLFIS
jgi:hypothetical protein